MIVLEIRETVTFLLVAEHVYYYYLVGEETWVMQEIVFRRDLLYYYSREVGTFGLGNVDLVTLNDVLGWMVAVGTL